VKARLRRNWRLVRASWFALLRHRMLLVYPVLSTSVVALVAGYLPLALVWARVAEEGAAFAFTPQGIFGFLVLFIVTVSTVQFCNVMLVADALARMDGRYRMRLRGWRVAVPRIPTIVAYAVLSSTLVSIPILVICKVARLVGIRSLPEPGAWSLATFLGVPLIAAEGLGIRDTLERSASLLRAEWGSRFVGGIGVFVVRIAFLILSFIGGLVLLYLVTLIGYDPLSLAVAVLWLASFIFLFITGSAVSVIYGAATYRHCIGRPVSGFESLHDLPGRVGPPPMAEGAEAAIAPELPETGIAGRPG